MRYAIALLFFAVAPCNTPGRPFQGVAPVRVEVAGSTFDVRVRGELAEAIRVNSEYAPRLGPIGPRAAFAMARVSGCGVEGVLGDQAVVTGILDCSGTRQGANPLWQGALIRSYDCAEVRDWASGTTGRGYSDFDCAPY